MMELVKESYSAWTGVERDLINKLTARVQTIYDLR